ncbi:ArsR/SmtB family transcription factor [Novosphingobium lentum]|uniref:ArsR/SmtB family transcription factor n=1 Tax=Novosphingobium lentum TaxID=145287 RepID=UPI000834F10C|nr:metalloregulator ArsR/SmtB family transcription factor [Novosphingobium lentum]
MENNIAVAALSALAHGGRLAVFRLLVQAGLEGLPAGEIARSLGVPANTMSTHLAILSHAGLATFERHSRFVVYRANIDSLRELMVFLAKDCCQGREDLCGQLIIDLSCS